MRLKVVHAPPLKNPLQRIRCGGFLDADRLSRIDDAAERNGGDGQQLDFNPLNDDGLLQRDSLPGFW
jgi:hypothetical protein